MRRTNNEIKDFINESIINNKEQWKWKKGEIFGVPLQKEVGQYMKTLANVESVDINTNQNDPRADIIVKFYDGTCKEYEVKSCKNGKLPGVSICNSPHLLNNKDTFLLNYTVDEEGYIQVLDVYETQLFRLTGIQTKGKYMGCLISTRDTGKKIKGRTFNSFISTDEAQDTPLEELTNPSLIRKTVLYYSASKLVDCEYEFTDEEILNAVHSLK